ncbi:hypothetical protein PCE1_001455 [Barthelona sp. PCE]
MLHIHHTCKTGGTVSFSSYEISYKNGDYTFTKSLLEDKTPSYVDVFTYDGCEHLATCQGKTLTIEKMVDSNTTEMVVETTVESEIFSAQINPVVSSILGLGCADGIICFNLATQQPQMSFTVDSSIVDFEWGVNGTIVWCLTADNRIVMFDMREFGDKGFDTVFDLPEECTFKSIALDKEMIWISGEKHLACYAPTIHKDDLIHCEHIAWGEKFVYMNVDADAWKVDCHRDDGTIFEHTIAHFYPPASVYSNPTLLKKIISMRCTDTHSSTCFNGDQIIVVENGAAHFFLKPKTDLDECIVNAITEPYANIPDTDEQIVNVIKAKVANKGTNIILEKLGVVEPKKETISQASALAFFETVKVEEQKVEASATAFFNKTETPVTKKRIQDDDVYRFAATGQTNEALDLLMAQNRWTEGLILGQILGCFDKVVDSFLENNDSPLSDFIRLLMHKAPVNEIVDHYDLDDWQYLCSTILLHEQPDKRVQSLATLAEKMHEGGIDTGSIINVLTLANDVKEIERLWLKAPTNHSELLREISKIEILKKLRGNNVKPTHTELAIDIVNQFSDYARSLNHEELSRKIRVGVSGSVKTVTMFDKLPAKKVVAPKIVPKIHQPRMEVPKITPSKQQPVTVPKISAPSFTAAHGAPKRMVKAAVPSFSTMPELNWKPTPVKPAVEHTEQPVVERAAEPNFDPALTRKSVEPLKKFKPVARNRPQGKMKSLTEIPSASLPRTDVAPQPLHTSPHANNQLVHSQPIGFNHGANTGVMHQPAPVAAPVVQYVDMSKEIEYIRGISAQTVGSALEPMINNFETFFVRKFETTTANRKNEYERALRAFTDFVHNMRHMNQDEFTLFSEFAACLAADNMMDAKQLSKGIRSNNRQLKSIGLLSSLR